MNQNESEESLIRRSLQGNRSAFRQLYENHAQAVFQTAYRLVGERTSAEDITQEVFITIYENLNNFEHRSAFGTWCYRITVNKCIDVMRKQRRRQKHKKGTINPDKFDLLLRAETNESPDEKLKRNVFTGKNILYKKHTVSETAEKFDMSTERVKTQLQKAEQTLFEIRLQRPNPFLDDKIVLSWNGLMISAYANGYAILEKKSYLDHAEQSFEFLMDNMYDADSGTFKRRYRAGESHFDANLADYAYLVQGLLDLYQATDKQKYLDYARKFTDKQISLFYDEKSGAFYDTRMEDKHLLMRTKEFYDGARPSGNSVAVNNLVRLAKLTENDEYAAIADETIKYFGKYLNQQPSAMPKMLQGLAMYLNPEDQTASADAKK